MKYKAIIFDMDGTIITTESVWEQSTKHLLQKHAALSDHECHTIMPMLKGASLHVTCEIIHKTFNIQVPVAQLVEEKQKFAFDRFGKAVQLIEGFDMFHQKLLDKKLRCAIATNASQTELDQILLHVPLNNFFKGNIYTIDRVAKNAKPKPDIYLYAAQQLNVQPEHCIAIEDSRHGVAAAKAAGMYCIGINTGNDHTALAQADQIIEHYDDINLETLL